MSCEEIDVMEMLRIELIKISYFNNNICSNTEYVYKKKQINVDERKMTKKAANKELKKHINVEIKKLFRLCCMVCFNLNIFYIIIKIIFYFYKHFIRINRNIT